MDDESGYSIDVNGEPEPPAARSALLRAAVTAALRRFHIAGAVVSLVLVDDAHIAELNERFLNHVGPTDVITFDLRESEVEGANGVDGEIIISTDTAAREALARGHEVDKELALYAVHGVLHLLGHDDADDADAAAMHVMEDEILTSLGMGRVFQSRVTG